MVDSKPDSVINIPICKCSLDEMGKCIVNHWFNINVVQVLEVQGISSLGSMEFGGRFKVHFLN